MKLKLKLIMIDHVTVYGDVPNFTRIRGGYGSSQTFRNQNCSFLEILTPLGITVKYGICCLSPIASFPCVLLPSLPFTSFSFPPLTSPPLPCPPHPFLFSPFITFSSYIALSLISLSPFSFTPFSFPHISFASLFVPLFPVIPSFLSAFHSPPSTSIPFRVTGLQVTFPSPLVPFFSPP